MKKTMLATQMIEKRIAHADHLLTGFPGERQLAEELGLGRDTVRIAVQKLVEKGALVRQQNGRLKVPSASDGRLMKTIGFVVPANLTGIDVWRNCVTDALENYGLNGQPVTLRPVTYNHWADPVLQEATSNFDGLFFIPPNEPIPSWLTLRLRSSSCRVAVIFQDASDAGLPSFISFPAVAERKLFDYLTGLGHAHIDCLNTQRDDPIIQNRIAVWKKYLEEHQLQGRLLSVKENNPIESGYRLIHQMLKQRQPLSSALFCTTGPAAVGAMRAMHEMDVKIGEDISICAVNSEGLGRFLWPSLTALEAPPFRAYVNRFCEWMLGDKEWQGPLLIEPDDLPLVIGGSTGPHK